MLNTVELSDVLLASAKEVFETMIFMDFTDVSASEAKMAGEAMLGSISFTNGAKGCMTICSDMECAKTIALNMLGMEPDAPLSESEIADAIGEVTNMIMGSVKTRIRDCFGEIQISCPTVIRGVEMKNSISESSKHVLVKLNIDDRYVAELTLMYKDNI